MALMGGKLFAGALFVGVMLSGDALEATASIPEAQVFSGGGAYTAAYHKHEERLEETRKILQHTEEEAIIFAIVAAINQGVIR